ncbi:hypothetical protein ACP8HZ_00155 [Francisella noatunensis]
MSSTNRYNLYSISECHDVAVYKLHPNDKYLEEDGVVLLVMYDQRLMQLCLMKIKKESRITKRRSSYIHSIGLANEYINKPDLNTQRFITAANSPIKKRLS